MAQGTEVVLLSMDTQQTLTQTIAKGQGLLTAVGQKSFFSPLTMPTKAEKDPSQLTRNKHRS